VEEIRVTDWSELHEQLYADSWNEKLGLHRSNFAFRGRPLATDDLATSLARLGGDADDAEIARVLRESVAGKWEGHEINTARFIKPERLMHSIGG